MNVKTLQKTKQGTFEKIALNPVNQLMMASEIKTDTLATTFHNPEVSANNDVQFLYGPHTTCNHNWVQVSGSMSDDAVNEKHTGQKSTK